MIYEYEQRSGPRTVLGVHLAEAVVAELVHEAIQEDRRAVLVDAELLQSRVRQRKEEKVIILYT